MMSKVICVSLFLIAAMLLSVGCSGTQGDPVIPENYSPTKDNQQRYLLGIWDVSFDLNGLTASITTRRDLAAHLDVTGFITPPQCNECIMIYVYSFDPYTRILDADITVLNPEPNPVYDARYILMTNEKGHLLTNPDGWTDLFDLLGGMDINPFKAFAKEVENRTYLPYANHTEKYLVYIPKPPDYAVIRFVADACYPSNCTEPYSIENFTHGELASTTGSSCVAEVTVRDWQENASDVKLNAPEITDEEFVDFTHYVNDIWQLDLVNNMGAPAGDYEVLIQASSTDADGHILYNFITITII
jgi:hypothetical protein